jgi:glutamate-1-semialdehyde 2,1-aminomutase
MACGVMPGGVNSTIRNIEPHLVITRTSGARITDAEGNEYIDYQAAFGPPLLGHNHPEVNRRVAEALEQSLLPGVGVTPLEIKLAQKICQHVPSAQKVLFCNSGSEATFHALRVARAYTGRRKILKFQGCYHGFHDAVLTNVLSPPDRIGQPDPHSAGMLSEVLDQTLVAAFNRLEDVEDALESHRDEVAAIIVEPVAHNMGCVLPKPGFLEGLRGLATRHGAVLIFDEVITGFRHHLGGYQAICGVTPDLTALGKAIANGFPLAAVCGRAEIMDHFTTRPGGDAYYAGTFNGNAMSMAAALTVVDILEREPVHQHIFTLGNRMRRGLETIHSRLGTGATVAQFGSIFLTYFMDAPIESYSDVVRNDVRRFLEYRRRLMRRGIFKIPLNLKRNHISGAHTEADIDRTLEASEAVLKEMVAAPQASAGGA